ncbi:MAG: cobalamin B12-binding domain-containing protein [Promethearchaeota archaeon]
MSLKEDIKNSILEFDEDGLKKRIETALSTKEADPLSIIKIIGNVMTLVGDKFEKEEYFLPELIMSANIVKSTIDEILDPALRKMGQKKESLGKVVIGTVEGDVHSIGKDLIASFLFSNGFEVYNLGEEVPAERFINKAEEVNAQVIGLSSLLTMSLDFQRQVIQELKKRGLRDKYKVIVGGSPTSEEWANQIGADGWADDALEAVALVKKLLNKYE